MTDPAYLAGHLLLAMPGMFDPRFERAVIAMCLHDSQGALGICLGRIRETISFHEVLEEAGIDPDLAPDREVLDGGPVEPERGFILHTPDWTGEGTIAVTPLCAMTASLDILRAIAEGSGPSRWLMALGYAGWGAGQLESEMRHHGWYAASAHPQVLFETPAPQRWTASWRAEGIDPALLASETGRA